MVGLCLVPGVSVPLASHYVVCVMHPHYVVIVMLPLGAAFLIEGSWFAGSDRDAYAFRTLGSRNKGLCAPRCLDLHVPLVEARTQTDQAKDASLTRNRSFDHIRIVLPRRHPASASPQW